MYCVGLRCWKTVGAGRSWFAWCVALNTGEGAVYVQRPAKEGRYVGCCGEGGLGRLG